MVSTLTLDTVALVRAQLLRDDEAFHLVADSLDDERLVLRQTCRFAGYLLHEAYGEQVERILDALARLDLSP
jgi:hypothetical protein